MRAPAVGQRKLTHAREMALILFAGFVAAIVFKAPETIFGSFVAGLGVQSGAFIWGNAREHQAKSKGAEPTPAS